MPLGPTRPKLGLGPRETTTAVRPATHGGHREDRRAVGRHADQPQQGTLIDPSLMVRCTLHPFSGMRTVRNMVADGRGGMQCTPRHLCITRHGGQAAPKRVRTRSERRTKQAARLRSRSRERRSHRQPPIV